jgi:signal transduction histidine kinase/ligand-binding sensor domain-containing protein
MEIAKRIGLAFLYLNFVFLFGQEESTQTPSLSGVTISIERISTEDGLSNSLVHAITQDKQGFIWIGTEYGLNRYDGQNFTIYTSTADTNSISNSSVLSLCEDQDGFLWVGTYWGLNRFDPVTLKFKRYFHNPGNISSLSNNEIRSIYQDRSGVIWVGTALGLNKFEKSTQTWKHFFPTPNDSSRPGDNFINTILEDNQGTFWIGTGDFLKAGGGLFKFDRNNKSFSRYQHNSSGLKKISSDWITSLYEDRSGTLWVGVDNDEVNKLDGASGTLTHFRLPLEGPTSQGRLFIKSILEDKTEALWIATWGTGVYRFDKRTRTFSRYTFDASKFGGLSSPAVNTLFLDRAGLLWVGTDRGGVNTIATRPFVHRHKLGNSLNIDSRVDGLFEDDQGKLWIKAIGTRLWRFDPTTGIAAPLPRNIDGKVIFQDSADKVWINALVEVIRYDPQTNQSEVLVRIPKRQGSLEWIVSFLRDKEGSLWLGTAGSLYRFAKDLKDYYHYVYNPSDPKSISAGQVETIVEDRVGNIWVSTGTGLNRFDKVTQSFTRFLHNEKDSSSISSNGWPQLHQDRFGTLWVGTTNGLNRWNEINSTFTRFVPDNRAPSRTIGKIVEDDKGYFWYATATGVSMFEPTTGKFSNFNLSNNFELINVLGWNQIKLNNGELLFGTANGILVFNPEKIRTAPQVPVVVVTGIKIFNQRMKLNTSPELLRNISFNHDENVFSIEYAVLSYDMTSLNQYAYFLEGIDKDWVYCGTRREATYTNLDPGVYRFRVKGSNHDGVWNEAGTSLTITILPTYWQTWWFRSLTIVLSLSLIVFIYQRKVNRLKKEKFIQREFSRKQIESQEAERKRLASELHDGLGQNLLVIKNELQQFLSEQNVSKEDLQRVTSMAQESVENVREISSNLHPHHIERLGFCAAVKAMTENISHSAKLKIACSCDKLDRQMPKEFEIHIYRIIQEGLSNIVRHAFAHSAQVEVRKNLNTIEVIITDDGCGFNIHEFLGGQLPKQTGDVSRGFGLASMSERARIIGGALKIDSSTSSGTTIRLTLPLS